MRALDPTCVFPSFPVAPTVLSHSGIPLLSYPTSPTLATACLPPCDMPCRLPELRSMLNALVEYHGIIKSHKVVKIVVFPQFFHPFSLRLGFAQCHS